MSLQAFIPEVWNDTLITALRKTLVYGDPSVVNHDYEGDIRAYGDTVRITAISRPSVTQYIPNQTTITPETIITAGRSLVIDQAWVWGFKIDDVDQAQARGTVMSAALSESGYSVAEKMDLNIASLYTQAASANVIAPVTVDLSSPTSWDAEAAKAYNDILIPLKVKLDEANVPFAGRYCIIPPWLHGVLLRDPRFVKVNESGTQEGLRNGQVGRAAGFDILISNNVPVPTANNYVVTAGTNAAITVAQQLVKTEAYRPENDFSDAVKGIAVWGSKVVRPDCLAYATAISS